MLLLLQPRDHLSLALRAQPLRSLELLGGCPLVEPAALAAAAAQHIGLVEEHDHAAVAKGELAQLAIEVLDLHRRNTDERLHERRWIDEHVWLTGLACRCFRHQRLAGAGWAPQQDAAGHVATAVFDLLRTLEEVEVLLDPANDVILAPDVGEPGLDLTRLEGLDTTDEEDAEEEHDVDETAECAQCDRQADRQTDCGVDEDVAEDASRRLGESLQRAEAPHPREDQTEDAQDGQTLHEPRHAPSRVRLHLAHLPFPAAEHLLLPELVVGLRVLGDDVVDLADHFQPSEDQHPPLGAQLIAQCLAPRHQWDVRLLMRCLQQDEDRHQHQDLDAVVEEHLAAHGWFAVIDDRLVHRRVGRQEG